MNKFLQLQQYCEKLHEVESVAKLLQLYTKLCCELSHAPVSAIYTPSPGGKHMLLEVFHSSFPHILTEQFRKVSALLPIVTNNADALSLTYMQKTPIMHQDFISTLPLSPSRLNATKELGLTKSTAFCLFSENQILHIVELFFTKDCALNQNNMPELSLLSTFTAAKVQALTYKEKARKQDYEYNRTLEEKTRRLLKAKQEAESANNAKTEFLANISHELRTPMHAILSFSAMGKKKTEDEKLLKYFSSIHESGSRLLQLLDKLLDLSKLEISDNALSLEHKDMYALVEQVTAELWSLLQSKKLTLELIPNPSLNMRLEMDSFKIAQVILNLLSNAIKFSPIGATITITFERRTWQDANLRIPALAVLVIDEGPGIPDGEEELVFDKFVQSSKTRTGAGGTGLGLAICKEIIAAHHGAIYGENNLELGATFTFELPMQQPVKY